MARSIDLSKEPIGIIGTGMMAKGIATLYLRSGLNTFIGSRDAVRGEQFAKQIQEETRSNSGISIRGGSVTDVLTECRVIILAVPTMHKDDNGDLVEGVIHFLNKYEHLVRGKHKILIDITYYGRSFGNPSPPGDFTSALTYHSNTFGDTTAVWVGGYKSVMWTSLRDSKYQGIEIAGDEEGRKVFSEIITKTGFKPLDCGDLSSAGVIEPGGPLRKPHPEASV